MWALRSELWAATAAGALAYVLTLIAFERLVFPHDAGTEGGGTVMGRPSPAVFAVCASLEPSGRLQLGKPAQQLLARSPSPAVRLRG